jgi:signal transduction histidine kinase
VEETISEVRESGKMQVIEFAQEVEGSRRCYEARFTPLPGSQVLGIFRDITDRRAGETALRQAEAKLQLLSGITRNDFQNLLTTLTAYQELALESAADPLVLGYLEKEMGITSQICSLVRFTRFYQGIGSAAPSWQDPHGILARIVRDLDTRGIPVIYDLRGIEIYADPLLERALASLVENAVLHGEGATRIQFGYEEGPSGLLVTCEDDGGGIPEADKEKIFTRIPGGHQGLDLFLAREILGITGLSIRETGEFARGARFEISVPPGNYRFPGEEEKAPRRTSVGVADLPTPPAER